MPCSSGTRHEFLFGERNSERKRFEKERQGKGVTVERWTLLNNHQPQEGEKFRETAASRIDERPSTRPHPQIGPLPEREKGPLKATEKEACCLTPPMLSAL